MPTKSPDWRQLQKPTRSPNMGNPRGYVGVPLRPDEFQSLQHIAASAATSPAKFLGALIEESLRSISFKSIEKDQDASLRVAVTMSPKAYAKLVMLKATGGTSLGAMARKVYLESLK